MHGQIESKKVFIARNCVRTPGLTDANLLSKIGVGEVLVVDQGGKIVDTPLKAQKAKYIRIVQGTDLGYQMSDTIEKDKVTRYEGTKFRQSTEQRTAIGYNGTSGKIELFDDNNYAISLERENTGVGTFKDELFYKLAFRSPLANTTQFMVVNGLAIQMSHIIYNTVGIGMKVNVITDTVGVGGLTGAEVINGSKAVSYAGGTVNVGEALIVPGLTGTPYRDELNSVYEVTAVDTVNKVVTLDREYLNAGQTGISINKIVDTSLDNYGIMFEGVINKYQYTNGDYIKTYMEIQREGFGISLFTNKGTGFELDPGNGRYEPVSIEEFYYQTNQFNAEVHKNYASYSKTSEKGKGYSGIAIKHHSIKRINLLESNGAIKETVIFLERGVYQDIKDNLATTSFNTNILTGSGSDTTAGSSLLNVLNAFMVDAKVIKTGVNTINNEGLSLLGAGTYNAGIDL